MPANPNTVAVAGIVVSGVVGPTMTAWAVRHAARLQFVRDRAATRRDELLTLLDGATAAISLGAVRLREMKAARGGSAEAVAAQSWAENIFAYGQRLALRLGSDHPVTVAYEAVRVALTHMGERGEVSTDDEAYENATLRFEAERRAFLAKAQAALDAPISDKEGAS